MSTKTVSKYEPAKLPSQSEAETMALECEEWTKQARERDQLGSAREFELTALLLREYAKQGPH